MPEDESQRVNRELIELLNELRVALPGIQVLWWGCFIMFTGGFLCYRRRALLARKPQPAKAPAAAPTRRPTHGHAAEPAGAE